MSNISSLQAEIQTALEEHQVLRKVDTHIDEIDNQLKAAYQKIKSMDVLLDKELKDIAELEKIGVKSLFYKTLGNKEAQLEKERQDYLELSLKYKEYKKEVELMEYERDLLNKKLTSVKELEQRLARLKELRKTEILNSSNNPLRSEYQKLTHDLDTNIILAKEVQEAREEGENSIKVLAAIVSYLDKAEDWGRWDMYGDNRRAKFIKQQSVEQALRLIPKAQHRLNLFMRELKDLGENDIVVKIDSVHFNKFRDFFFDNLISDWIIQQRIRNTLSNIEGTLSHVQRIVLGLNQESAVLNNKIQSIKAAQEKIVLS